MRKIRLGLLIIAVMLLAAAFTASSGVIDMDKRLSPPSSGYIFGCDSFGRSLLPRISYGFLVSLFIGITSALIAIALALAISFIIVRMGRLKPALLALLDGIKVVPSMVLALFLASVSGPGIVNVIAVLVYAFIPGAARTCYSMMAVCYGKPYIEASYSEGAGEGRVFFRHILPHLLPLMREEGISLVLSAMLIESSLSFIGAGVSLDTPSLGLILQEARPYMLTYPHMAFFPSLIMVLLASSLLLISSGLAELDPASH